MTPMPKQYDKAYFDRWYRGRKTRVSTHAEVRRKVALAVTVTEYFLRRGELLKRTFIMTAASDESLQFIDRTAVAGVLRKPFEVATLPDLVAKLVR